MLCRQARFGPTLPDIGYANGLSGHCREGHGCTYNLAAAFPKGTVYLDHQSNPSFVKSFIALSINEGLRRIIMPKA
jgi:hypothetical protein